MHFGGLFYFGVKVKTRLNAFSIVGGELLGQAGKGRRDKGGRWLFVQGLHPKPTRNSCAMGLWLSCSPPPLPAPCGARSKYKVQRHLWCDREKSPQEKRFCNQNPCCKHKSFHAWLLESLWDSAAAVNLLLLENLFIHPALISVCRRGRARNGGNQHQEAYRLGSWEWLQEPGEAGSWARAGLFGFLFLFCFGSTIARCKPEVQLGWLRLC